MATDSKNNQIIVGVNVLVYLLYAAIFVYLQFLGWALLFIGLHFIICCIVGGFTKNTRWYLSAALVLLLGLGTCFAVVFNVVPLRK